MKLALVLLVGLVVACSKPADQYTVNGKVVALGAKATDKIDIHHEAIPTYKHRDGKVRGMASMVMSFAPTGANLPSVAVGDIVRVTFSVHWDSDPGTRIESMSKLPPDTTLVLE
jgi:Copper binding periplasmic protein CusF